MTRVNLLLLAALFVTRSIVKPDTITMKATANGGEVLDIRHGRGHTIAAVADTRQQAAT